MAWVFMTAVFALQLDTSSSSSVCSAASTVAKGLLNYYEGTKYGGTVGMFSYPYYWWQAGEAFGALLDYISFCPDDNVKQLVYQGMTSQLGDKYDLMVSNFSTSEGNDDQGVWALAIMTAAEKGFPDPVGHLWAEIGANVFNSMFGRWDAACKGGIRWQIFSNNNNGYGYKNSIANGALFTLAARLSRYNGDSRYAYIADFVWSWTEDVEFLTEQSDNITIYDGGNIDNGCQDRTEKHWSYNYGIYLLGAAYVYDVTNDEKWLARSEKLLTSIEALFFDSGVMYESECQDAGTCNNDQRSFKGMLARSLAGASVLLPSLSDKIDGLLKSSASAAAESCSGGSDGVTCGLDWFQNGWDGKYGLGEQVSALETIQNVLVHSVALKKH